MPKYPTSHGSTNWLRYMPIVIKDILKREHKLTAYPKDELIVKIAATVLGHDLRHYDGQRILRDDLRKVASILLEKSKKLQVDQDEYEMRSSHAWALKSYGYIRRRIEENVLEVHPDVFSTTVDTLVIGEFAAVMQVPRIIEAKLLSKHS